MGEEKRRLVQTSSRERVRGFISSLLPPPSSLLLFFLLLVGCGGPAEAPQYAIQRTLPGLLEDSQTVALATLKNDEEGCKLFVDESLRGAAPGKVVCPEGLKMDQDAKAALFIGGESRLLAVAELGEAETTPGFENLPGGVAVSTTPLDPALLGELLPAGAQGPELPKRVFNVEGVLVKDLVVGNGTELKSGDGAKVHYIGTLEDGTVFDSSFQRNQPATFTIGVGQLIKGWDVGMVGMREGGKRKLVIPPDMGYGSRAKGPIPANSTLTFEITLLEVNP